jgi:hypothetical protein
LVFSNWYLATPTSQNQETTPAPITYTFTQANINTKSTAAEVTHPGAF